MVRATMGGRRAPAAWMGALSSHQERGPLWDGLDPGEHVDVAPPRGRPRPQATAGSAVGGRRGCCGGQDAPSLVVIVVSVPRNPGGPQPAFGPGVETRRLFQKGGGGASRGLASGTA